MDAALAYLSVGAVLWLVFDYSCDVVKEQSEDAPTYALVFAITMLVLFWPLFFSTAFTYGVVLAIRNSKGKQQ